MFHVAEDFFSEEDDDGDSGGDCGRWFLKVRGR